MNMKKIIGFIVGFSTILVTANVFAERPVTLIINNQTSNTMTLINSKLNRMTVEPDFLDSIAPKTAAPYMLKFDDDMNKIIDDSAEINYYVDCPNGSRDKFTIKGVGKIMLLKVMVAGFSVERSIVDGQCSRIRTGNGINDVRAGDSLEIVIVPKTEVNRK